MIIIIFFCSMEHTRWINLWLFWLYRRRLGIKHQDPWRMFGALRIRNWLPYRLFIFVIAYLFILNVFEYFKKPTKAPGCTVASFLDYGPNYGESSGCMALSSCDVSSDPHAMADYDGVTIQLAFLAWCNKFKTTCKELLSTFTACYSDIYKNFSK